MTSTTITIYSHWADNQEWRDQRAKDGLSTDPTWTGEVNTTDLDEIWRLFNRVSTEDNKRLRDMGYTLPSLSMGDVITINGEHHALGAIGFGPMTDQEFRDYKAIVFDEKFSWQMDKLKTS